MSLEIPLTRGQVALIDECDAFQVAPFKWFALWASRSKTYYAAREQSMDDRTRVIPMHRWIIGIEDLSVEIDHWNHIGTDNRRSNLRICTHQQNVCNRRGWNSSSAYKGIRYRSNRKWEARIRVNGKELYLGQFSEEAHAAEAYNRAATAHFGEFAYLNKAEGAL